MSARARFVPGSAPQRQQPASSTPASSEPPSSFPARSQSQPDDGDSIIRSASRAGDHDSSRPLNTSSLKKLTSKKSAGRATDPRAAAVAPEERVQDPSLSNSIASPDPRHPSAPLGPPDFSMFRPPSPRPRAVSAMLPPPAPPSAYNQARPKSRAAHAQQQQHHVSPFDQPSVSHHSEQYSNPQPAPVPPQALDFAQPYQNPHPTQRGSGQHIRTSTVPADHRNVSRPPDIHYRDSPGRRSMSVESNAGTNNKRFADELEVDSSDHPAKRLRVDDMLQNEMHYADGRRGTSPLSDLEPMADGLNSGPSTQTRPHHFQQRDDMAPTGVHPLQQLMGGFDLAAFAGAHAKQYELDYAKWEASSHAEWEAYGSVLVEQFSKCIDMVKEYMGRKVQLHASLQGITEKHRGVLRKRDKAIEGITGGLAKQTTQALSRNSSLTDPEL